MQWRDKIYSRVCTFMGREEAENMDCILPLCSCAEAELARILREDVTPEDCGECYITAGALLALDMYGQIQGWEKIKSFRAGEIAYTREETLPGQMRQQAYRLLRPWCRPDESFAFREVRG